MNENPKISVVTIVFNRKNDILQTAQSVLGQSYKNVEYLVIDGGSTDGTLEQLQTVKTQISYLVSEVDAGIYDAMNKGLQAATGEYIIFMNAGDTFNNTEVLGRIFEIEKSSADIIYGDTQFVSIGGQDLGLMSKVRQRPLHDQIHWTEMRYGMMFCHQSFIVKKSIAPLYDLTYRYSADIDWIIKCLKNSTSSYFYRTTPIANFQIGGASLQNRQQSLIERFKVITQHFGLLQSLLAHLQILLKIS